MPSTARCSSGCRPLREELAAERARGRATYAEVEESEADLKRFRSWLAKIEARDYFAAPAGDAARAAVEQAAADLAAFEQAALTVEAPAEAASAPVTPVRPRPLRVEEDV
jgi:hypothetical protein